MPNFISASKERFFVKGYSLFNELDTVQQREAWMKARTMSESTDHTVILHCRTLGGDLAYSMAHTWRHWDSMEVCRFRRGRELN